MSPEYAVVPLVLCAGDPRAGDASLRDPGSWADFRRWGGVGEPAELEARERAFHERYLAVLAGELDPDDPELAALAAWLGVAGDARHDSRAPRVAEVAVPDAVLADVTEDLVPDVGVLLERVTGDEGAPGEIAGAVLAFVELLPDARRPVDVWFDEETDRALARSGTVIGEAPPCVWADGAPIFTIAAPRVPPRVPPGVFVGRAYRVGGEWTWSAVLPLPRAPARAPLERRLRLELWRHRLGARRSSFEDMLRARPDLVYRTACEGAR